MTFMAVPMVVLYFISELIARAHDKRKDRDKPFAGLSPDEPSPL
jgi:sec-independent protein translocase protein TatC